ncbi:hypothetical protein JR316_0009864 [Psilocybe cubensis]|uniref:Uncharacterized protein n=1 Tax=Psilocybe cubensis TaxID=181762 RepID=A0ACB8GPR1_PSICU|nr:hypothetical protein JR316_0009864 [Psilocybe cubensis]KAH9477638.1 hypothetical protein JR316_0009864 [Psilocybe cubensis]
MPSKLLKFVPRPMKCDLKKKFDKLFKRTSGGAAQMGVVTNPDVQEMPQSSVDDNPAVEREREQDVDEPTPFTVNDARDAHELVHVANSLMAEQKSQLSLSNLDNSVLLFRQVLQSRDSGHPLRKQAMNDLASALGVRYMYTNQRPDVMEFLQLVGDVDQAVGQQADAAVSNENSSEMESQANLATGLLRNFHKSTSLDVLNRIVDNIQKALPHLPAEHATRMIASPTLVNALYARQHHTDDLTASDLSEAISVLEEAITHDPTSWNLVFQVYILLVERFNLKGDALDLQSAKSHLAKRYVQMMMPAMTQQPKSAEELFDHYFKTRNLDDLNSAIEAFRKEIATLARGTESYAFRINGLACALWSRFKNGGGDSSDIDEAISLHEQNIDLLPPPHPSLRLFTLNNMAIALSARFDIEKNQNDLDKAISLHRTAISEVKHGTDPPPDSLFNLANALLTRSKQGQQYAQDSDESITLYKKALDLYHPTHSNRSSALDNLAAALVFRVDQGRGDTDNLNDALSLIKQALALCPPSHPLRSHVLSNMASVLSTRFSKGMGSQADLHEVVSLRRQALELQSGNHPNRANSLSDLATSLTIRFEQGLGTTSDLDDAITFFRQALELRPSTHRNYVATLYHLANSLTTRYNQRSQLDDLDEAIVLHREALDLHPPPHPNRANCLNSLANVLLTRFRQTLDQSNLDKSIRLHRQALELVQQLSDPDHASVLEGLAVSLSTRFMLKDQQCDIDEAISLDRRALKLRPPSASFQPLTNLAVNLATLFDHSVQERDLDEAIELHRQAELLVQSPAHPNRSMTLINLANTLYRLFEHKQQRAVLDEAMLFFSEATKCLHQSPSRRFDISKQWAHAADRYNHESVITAYETAVQSLPQVAALTLTIELRQQALASTGSDGLARDASSCAIRFMDYTKAIEFSEAGRGVFWSQLLSLRSPFDRVRGVEPDGPMLADRLQEIALELEYGAHRQILAGSLGNPTRLVVDQESSRVNRLGEEWENILRNVRKLRGLENFLLPPRLSTLQTAASKHPICLIISSKDSSHCLLMKSTTIHDIPLPNLNASFLKILVENLQMGVSTSTRPQSDLMNRTRNAVNKILGDKRGISYLDDSEDSDGIFKFVLRILWDEMVKPIIDFLQFEKRSENLPTLQWCLTGHFTFLPIHAAGNYDDEKCIDCALDYFISSYTPTICVLCSEGPPTPPTTTTFQPFQMMAVIQPQALPATTDELQKIQQYVPSNALVALGTPEAPAAAEDVLA